MVVNFYYPDIFSQKETSVLTIDVERTFWEKLTILHKIANFPEGKPLPARYARHLYDVYNIVAQLSRQKSEIFIMN